MVGWLVFEMTRQETAKFDAIQLALSCLPQQVQQHNQQFNQQGLTVEQIRDYLKEITQNFNVIDYQPTTHKEVIQSQIVDFIEVIKDEPKKTKQTTLKMF